MGVLAYRTSLPAWRWARASARIAFTRSAMVAASRGSAQKFRPTPVGVTGSGALHSAPVAEPANPSPAVSSAAAIPARTRRLTLLGRHDPVSPLAVLHSAHERLLSAGRKSRDRAALSSAAALVTIRRAVRVGSR